MACMRRFSLSLLLALFWLILARSVWCAPATNWTWIWTPDGTHPSETLFFRERFRLTKKPLSARLLITADDSFTAYLNERKTPVARGNDWTTVLEFDLTSQVRAGDNLLAIEVRNTGGAGGLLYKLIVQMPGGKTLSVFSNARVHVNRRVPPLWTLFAVDDSNWPRAVEIAPPNKGPWGKLRGAPVPDPSRLTRLWDMRAGAAPGEDPYSRPRNVGDRMLLCASVSSPTEMQILSSAGFTLFQTDSDHLSTEETAPNKWDFREADLARQTVHNLGLDWCYFPHEAFPPPWYRQSVPFTRIQCLEHQQPVQAFSPWEPGWADFIDNGYKAIAREFGAKETGKGSSKPVGSGVSALYVGVHGDYGEAGLLMGGRVSVPGQREDWQRRFGNLHDHLGWWCNDPLARADFRAQMLKKYGSLERLNAAWKRSYKSKEEIDYPAKPRGEARREWLDFVDWYHDGVRRAIELNLDAARKYFPTTELMLPAGFSDEDPRGGNDNSLIPKLAARYKADVRSTHGAFKPFAENTATMLGRLGSASRFYGAPFWTEPPSGLTANQEIERIFEAVSQGAKGHFDWATNAIEARDVYYRYGKYLRVEKPVVDVAMFYPAEAQKLRLDQGYAPLFAQACAYLRDVGNFDIVDDRMVQDDCLSRYRVLVLWEGTLADPQTLDKIKAWVNDGGTLVAYDFGKVTTFEGDTSWFTEMFGYVQQLAPARVTERFVGKVPTQYRIAVTSPEAADFLGSDWYMAETEGGVSFRWTGANATMRLPVDPEKGYVLMIRAYVPPDATQKTRRVLLNGREIGRLDSPGDVTYRFPVTTDALNEHNVALLTFQCETFQRTDNPQDKRPLGVRIQSVSLVEPTATEGDDVTPPVGAFRMELDLNKLNTDWTRRYGKGLTIYFPATRQLIKAYLEVVRRAIYRLSAIDPGRRDALPVDNSYDGVYATLFTDKVLYYNPKDTAVTKTVTIPSEAFAQWRGEVAIPTETSWKLTLEPHSLGAIYFSPPPQELLFECEKFTDLGGNKAIAYADCSPGKGVSGVHIGKGSAISTRFVVETAGRYALYVRCLRSGKLEPVDVLLDGQAIQPVNAKAGQTLLAATLPLARGTHTLTLRARPTRDVRADFILLTNDPTIAGYGFGVRTAAVE